MRAFLMVVEVFASLAIIGLVLLQRGKGADAGAGFGSGASGTVFGARGATTTLSRATAIFAAVFMICSMALAYMGTRPAAASKSLLDQVVTEQPQAPAKPLPTPSAPTQLGPTQLGDTPKGSSPAASTSLTVTPVAPKADSQPSAPNK